MNKRGIIFFLMRVYFLYALPVMLQAQVTPSNPNEPSPLIKQQLENLTQANDDATTQDDSYLQELVQFTKDPINMNDADEGQLEELRILNALQISNFILYRKLLGKFISIYELQAVPGWSVDVIKQLLPYITVSAKVDVYKSLRSRFKNGRNTLLVRASQVLEKSIGYLRTTSSNYYEGSPQHITFRYKYSFKNLMQCGITGDKDAGEQFFKGSQKQGFDFYSAHFFARDLGIIKSVALGDFIANLGQGLTQWGGLAFRKSADVLNIKRQADVLRPYNSTGEIAFNRGAGITLQKKNWEATGFVSYKKIDANFQADTVNFADFVSSLQTSGYHRTPGEIADKNSQRQLTSGGNISYSDESFHVGVNAVYYHFKYPIQKPEYLYNAYSLSGKNIGNYSIDYSYTYKNMHFFGEVATDQDADKAFIDGLLISVDRRVDMSFLYRHISRGYQSLYSNAFTETTFPTNESGFYSGISIAPTTFLRIDAYADYYKFPWLKYRVDALSHGNDYLIQVSYNSGKRLLIYSRYHSETKAINYNPDNLPLNPVDAKPLQNWRTQLSYRFTNTFTFRTRAEFTWFDKKMPDAENGWLVYADLLYKPSPGKLSASLRLQYFNTDGYNSRIYAYEDDILYSYSIPVFYGKGYRYYINFNYDILKKISIWIRFAETYYTGKSVIGSGLDEIDKHTRTEVKLQIISAF